MNENRHPDRVATTLAERAALLEQSSASTSTATRPDARVDLQLLRFAADRAIATRGAIRTRFFHAQAQGGRRPPASELTHTTTRL